ncbi:MAG TPA: hypothetical protein VGY66_10005 [Gemmataceae bacterium]|nr:hypothetical protein [Gemmataceae bacterium]
MCRITWRVTHADTGLLQVIRRRQQPFSPRRCIHWLLDHRFYRPLLSPVIYVLDQQGVIRAKHLRGSALDKKVDDLLQDKRGSE